MTDRRTMKTVLERPMLVNEFRYICNKALEPLKETYLIALPFASKEKVILSSALCLDDPRREPTQETQTSKNLGSQQRTLSSSKRGDIEARFVW